MTKNDTQSNLDEPTKPISNPPKFSSFLVTVLKSPGAKFFLICALALCLMIPLLFVWLLVEDRANRARNVASDISQSWGQAQTISGPFLVIPYKPQPEFTRRNNLTLEELTELRRNSSNFSNKIKYLVMLPSRLQANPDIDVQLRQRSIYRVPVYRSEIDFSGSFERPDFEALNINQDDILWKDAILGVYISDTKAIKSVQGKFGKEGSNNLEFKSIWPIGDLSKFPGINSPVAITQDENNLSFQLKIVANGTKTFSFTPIGKNTQATMTSNWPNPSFFGRLLPDNHKITEQGFSATWSVPQFARNYPQNFVHPDRKLQSIANEQIQVKFLEDINFYLMVSRSVKYALMFITVGFLTVFIMEAISGKRFHIAQYVLVGLALLLFYVLLLSLSEHIGFAPAYIVAGTAIAGLCSFYVGASLNNKNLGISLFFTLASAYALLYLILQLIDYALLAGSLFAFVVLAAVMYTTQRFDWSGKQKAAVNQT